MRLISLVSSAALLLLSQQLANAQSVPSACGSQAGGALCPTGQCCSQYGYCGTTAEYCLTSQRCQSQCINDGPPPPPAGPAAPDIDPSTLYVPPAGTFDHKGLVAYWSNWAQYRGLDPSTPACKDKIFLPENINPNLYTHLNYAFLFMANNFTVVPHEYDDLDLCTRFNNWIHKVNPSCTTSFSVGGWTMTDGPSKYTGGIDYSTFFSQMASTAENRQTFIQSCISFARQYGFDGIDIDWEYVGDPTRGGGPQDTENFTSLVKEFWEAFNDEQLASGKKRLLLSVAGPADPDKFALIQAAEVGTWIDWFNVMLYDFYGNWENYVEVNAPINDTINAKWSYTSGIDMYIHGGVAPNKIYAGLPLYGRVWTLTDPSQTAPGSPGTAGIAGRCTAEAGYLGYFEIDEIRQALRAQNLEDQALQYVPGDGYYLVFDDQWVGFDDVYSFQAKIDVANDRGIRGTMLWAVDQDTPDMNLTRTLLSMYKACPIDEKWPATAAGSSAEMSCPENSLVPSASQVRPCDSTGNWGRVDQSACLGPNSNVLAAEICVNGQ